MKNIFSAIIADISNFQDYESNDVIKANVSYQKLYHPLLASAKNLAKQRCNLTARKNEIPPHNLVKPNSETLINKTPTTNSQAELLAHTGILRINNKSNITFTNHLESQPNNLPRPK